MRVLVAEDNADSRELLAQHLEDWGHAVTTTSDGAEALEAYRRGSFDIVVTDWQMPGLDGLELTRAIRASPADYAWIILLTANDFDANFALAMDAGVDDFLQKPLNSRLLMARIGVASRILQLRQKVDELSSFVPICMHCKAVRGDDQQWASIEDFLNDTVDVSTSHGMCPPCYYERSLRPDVDRVIALSSEDSVRCLDAALKEALRAKDPASISTAIKELESALERSYRTAA